MNMINLAVIAQIFIAVSIIVVWVFRYENIVSEFESYRLTAMMRNIVGAMKVSLATLLIVAIWYPELAVIPALLMGFLMLVAQAMHFKVKNPWGKHVPSLVLLVMCLFVASVYSGLIT